MVLLQIVVVGEYHHLEWVTHSLIVITAPNILLCILEYRGPIIAHLEYFMPSLAINEMSTIGCIMKDPENVVNNVFSYASMDLKVRPYMK